MRTTADKIANRSIEGLKTISTTQMIVHIFELTTMNDEHSIHQAHEGNDLPPLSNSESTYQPSALNKLFYDLPLSQILCQNIKVIQMAQMSRNKGF